MELASGLVATPTSPIEPALESGAIKRNGTAVVIVFSCKLRSFPSESSKFCALEKNEK